MCLSPKKFYSPHIQDYISVPCGKCLECDISYSNEWAMRISLEASLYPANCFITLTYDNEHLPSPPSVSRREVQLFIKRLRKRLAPLKIRFFGCGEYGKKFLRPHYHIIIFGWFPEDAYFFKKDGDTLLYRSPLLESVWPFGFSSVGEVSYLSAKYCAKYVSKYLFFSPKSVTLSPPFVQMSTRPGIGYDFTYKADLNTNSFYFQGRKRKIPRYFLKVMQKDGISFEKYYFNQKKRIDFYSRLPKIDRSRKYDKFFEIIAARSFDK